MNQTWHQYFHHWLYIFGWLGIGETILGLPHSGKIFTKRSNALPSSPVISPSTRTSNFTDTDDTRTPSPSHPISSIPARTTRDTSTKYMLSNFFKSLLVFTLTGLYHDLPSYILQVHTAPPYSLIPLNDCFPTTGFFMLQPFALAIEAYVKRYWRGWKNSVCSSSAKEAKSGDGPRRGEPAWIMTLERIVGFIWTWWWIGYTARFFVVGLTRAGLYLRKDDQPIKFSLAGGAIYGQWYH